MTFPCVPRLSSTVAPGPHMSVSLGVPRPQFAFVSSCLSSGLAGSDPVSAMVVASTESTALSVSFFLNKSLSVLADQAKNSTGGT